MLWRYPGAAAGPARAASTSPTTPSSPTAAPGSSPTRRRTSAIVQLAFPSGKVTWSYGHPGRHGSSPGYLHEPDDAYLLKNGTVTVADAQNCRILIIGPAVATPRQIGTGRGLRHDPPHSARARRTATRRSPTATSWSRRSTAPTSTSSPRRASSSGAPTCRSPIRRTRSSSGRTATWSPTTRDPGASTSSTGPGGSSGRTTRRQDPACSTTRASRSGCPTA